MIKILTAILKQQIVRQNEKLEEKIMSKTNFIKKYNVFFFILVMVFILNGCEGAKPIDIESVDSDSAVGTNTTVSTDKDNPEFAEATKVLIGTSGSPKPFLWVDEDDNIVGYDAEVIQAIDKLLPEYEFIFELTDFASIFTGIDARRYQMGVNNFAWKEERAEKYLYGDEYVCYEKKAILVKKGYDGIHGLDDIGKKSTFTSGNGLASQLFLENYNDQNPNDQVELIFTDADTLKEIQDLSNGVVDFLFIDQPMINQYLDAYPTLYDNIDIIELTDEEAESVSAPYTYFIYPKTEEGEKLKKAVDGALKTLKEDGTIKELSQEYVGYDVTGR